MTNMARKKLKVKVILENVDTGEEWESGTEMETDQAMSYLNDTGWFESAVQGCAKAAYRELSKHITNGN